jgi:hypothetical protein
MSDSIFTKLVRRPPIVFPLVALFLLCMSVVEMYFFWDGSSIYKEYLFRPLLMLLYTIFWMGCCMFKKWGAIGFVTLCIVQLCLILFLPDSRFKVAVVNNFFSDYPINLGMAFLVLFYFRRMN